MQQEQFNPLAEMLEAEEEDTASLSSVSTAYKPVDTAYNPLEAMLQAEEEERDISTLEEPSEYNPLAAMLEAEEEAPSEYDPDEYDLSVTKTFDEFAADQGYMDSVEEYAIARYGKENGAKQEGETNAEYLERWLSEVRQFENNSVYLAGQVDWVRGASEEEKANFGYVYSQLDKMPGFLSEGGGSAWNAVGDYVGNIISDPLTLLGVGAGKLGGMAAQRAIIETFKQSGKQVAKDQAKKIAVRAGAKPILAGTALEVGGETAAALGLQSVEVEAGIREEEDISLLEAGIVGGITGILGVGGGVLGQRGVAKETMKLIEDNEAFEAAAKAAAEAAGEGTEAVTKELADEGYEFNPIQGYEILRPLTEVIEETGLTGKAAEAQLKKEVSVRVTKAATEIAKDMLESGSDPQLQKLVDDKATAADVVRSILTREDIDSDIISGAIARAGLTPEEFANVSGATLSDAATITGAYGTMGKFLKRMRELDPELAQRYKDTFKADDSSTFWGTAHDYMMRLDRNRRALMVTQIATTARNVATGVMRLGFDAASNLIESSVYHLGRSGNALLGEGAITTGRRSGVQNILRDSFGVLGRLIDQGGSKTATDALLKYNPRLARVLDRSLTESGTEDLWAVSLFFNKLNMAQDVMFRRAVFADAVDKRLRRISAETMDLEKFIASGKALPNDILKDSVEEALSFTFARMPKPGGKKVGDTVGHYFIKINEAIGPLPIPGVGTGTFPFARFMVNAMQFQFEYSPLNAVNAIYHGAKGMHMKAIKGVSDAKTEAQMMKAREAMAKSIVGTAALTSAIYYRANNQDSKWYDITSDDGRTVDARPLFPIAPYLAVADLIVKLANDNLGVPEAQVVLEGVTGAQMRTGASSFVVDTFFEEWQAEGGSDIGAQRMGEIVGGYLGELTGGALTPLRVVNDIVAQFDAESAKVRDSSQAEGLNFSERAVSSYKNKIVKNIPWLQKTLPEFESATREGAVIKQSPLIGQLTGIRSEARRSDVEKELIGLGYESYNIVPSTGDKIADAYIKKHMGKLVETQLAREIDNDTYRNKSYAERKATMQSKLKRYRKIAKLMGEAESRRVGDKGYEPFDRAQWSKVSKVQRQLADEYYMERYGKTVMEMQEEEPNTNHLKIATIIARELGKTMR